MLLKYQNQIELTFLPILYSSKKTKNICLKIINDFFSTSKIVYPLSKNSLPQLKNHFTSVLKPKLKKTG
ncbi:MAG: hypothetical protein ACKO46_00060, partial [Alphaproteobacteria bacterium]